MLHHSLLGSLLVLKVTIKKLLKTNTFLEASHRSNYQFAKNFQIENALCLDRLFGTLEYLQVNIIILQ